MLGLSKRSLVCWINVILLLIIGTVYAHAKNPGPSLADTVQNPKSNATQENKQAEEDRRGTEKSPVVIKVLATPELQVTTKKSADEHRDYSSSEWWLVYATLILCTATIGLMFFTLKLWGGYKKACGRS
ncbi:MAG: hypothetical protein KGS09_01470 [Nitrospirae bacterium]|nr:hypothetical protein [Nitrospirota bacterium]